METLVTCVYCLNTMMNVGCCVSHEGETDASGFRVWWISSSL